jgi:outer membrane protein
VDGSLEFNPVSDSAALDRTASSAASRRALLLALQDDLLRDVGRAFLEVERAERQADVLRASVGVQEARVEEAKARFEAGVARPLDISLSESRAADARVRLIEAETIARTARTLLGFLVGADLRGVPLDDRVVVPAAQPTPEELRRIAHASRVEIEAAQHEIDAALAAVDEAAGLWWPSVALDVTVFLDRDSEPTDLDWTSFLEVRLPLFTAGRVQIEVRDALSRVRAAKQAHVRAKRAASTDVEDARARFDEVERRAAAVVVRVDAARRSLEQAEALWQTGQGTNLERLVAQDELLSAELELTTADLDRKVRHVEILRAAGTIHGLAGLKRPEPRLTEGPDAEAR